MTGPIDLLGVTIDSGLTWKSQVETIRSKVNKKMGKLRRTFGSVWGPSLRILRSIYISKIRSTIAYGCGVWFALDSKWDIAKNQIKKLRSIEYNCLRQISGAHWPTAAMYLYKELHIVPLEVWLHTTAMAFRARAVTRGEYRKPDLASHPFTKLHTDAQAIVRQARRAFEARPDRDATRWEYPKMRDKIINKWVKTRANERAAELWQTEQDRRAEKALPVLVEDWGKRSLTYYHGLSRPQCSLLLQCRTGFNGSRKRLYQIQKAESPLCDCGEVQTAKHLFCFCPLLSEARSALVRAIGHSDWARLMTRDARLAMDWAICYSQLEQYQGVKETAPMHFSEDRRDMLPYSDQCKGDPSLCLLRVASHRDVHAIVEACLILLAFHTPRVFRLNTRS